MTPSGIAAVLLTAAMARDTGLALKPLPSALSQDCFAELETGTAPEIACLFPITPSPQEREELEKGSRGYVKDFTCRLTVRMSRAEIDKALSTNDYAFKSPEQPVVCTITTYKSTFDVTATFAPEATFKNGVAISATPGLGNVKGISRIVSWPVVQFVNRWPSVREGMLTIINAYKKHKDAKSTAVR
jgi:hypothetical protein